MPLAGVIRWSELAPSQEGDPPLVAFDGELFDLAGVRLQAGAPPHTDAAAVIAYGFRASGLRFIEGLEGAFAAAIVERGAKRVHLVRDPTGQRPLLFATTQSSVHFGSLPNLLGVALHPSPQGITELVAGVATSVRATAFIGVSQVRSGEVATITPDGITFRRWWNPGAEAEPFDPARDYAGEYWELLEQAVQRRRTRGRVACQLSAGWDSSAVTSAVAGLYPHERIRAYTAAPAAPVAGAVMRHSLIDESNLAAETAAIAGISHQVIRARYAPFATARWYAQAAQAPLLAPFQLGWWNAVRDAAKADNATLLLTGEMGNLSLNASGMAMLGTLAARGQWGSVLREGRQLVRGGNVRWRGVAAAAIGDRLPERWLDWLYSRLAGETSSSPSEFLKIKAGPHKTAPVSPGAHSSRLAAIFASDAGVNRLLAEQGWDLHEADPTADRKLIEWSLRLPIEALLSNGVSRPMARKALAGRVAPGVLANDARGLQGADWYQQVTREECGAVLNEVRDVPLVKDIIDVPAIEHALGEWPTGDWNSAANYARFRIGVVNALCAGLFIARYS